MSNIAALLQFTSDYGQPPYPWKDWQKAAFWGAIILILCWTLFLGA